MTVSPSPALARLRAACALPSAGGLALACSGGLDSIVLLDLAAAHRRRTGQVLTVLHLDHGLRPESAADAAFVEAAAVHLGLPCLTHRANLRTGPGLEARARDARYAFLVDAARSVGARHVLTAHHRDDQVESIVLRLLRGAGPRGLRGMPASRRLASGLRLLRPLLHVRRELLRAHAEGAGLAWREDLTNADLTLARNRVRHALLPRLRAILPDADARLLELSRAAAGIADALASAARAPRAAVIRFRDPARLVLDLPGLASLSPTLRFEVLRPLVSGLGVRAFGRRAAALLEALVLGGPDGATHLPGGLRARRCGSNLVLEAREIPAFHSALVPGDGVPVPGAGRIEIELLTGGNAVRAALAEARRDNRVAVLVRDVLPGGLVVRTARPGDRYQPLGAPGRRRVTDLLADRGLPAALRSTMPVVEDALGILWAPPAAPAQRACITPQTDRGVLLRWAGPPVC